MGFTALLSFIVAPPIDSNSDRIIVYPDRLIKDFLQHGKQRMWVSGGS
jgi:hypothetical protein